MDPKQITALAKLLKESGDKVLNYEYKLSLSGSLLRALNDAFSLIVDKNEVLPPQSFQVVKPHNAKSDVFRDIQFIYDFVQKTVILSLNHFINDDPYEFEIDISKFRSLRKLEIQRIPIIQIIGIQQLRSQLIEITCIRSLSHVKEIITACGGDNSNGFTWNELKTANFSYNMLDHIDSSLEFAPWLESLNLSHNQIVSVSAIKWLPNLRVLNLSYNRLTHIPSFHVDAIKKIQVFYISNNFIEDLSGISRLLSLSELDVSGNCIVDHTALLPISTLASLCSLNLKDNPLACHPKHRKATARYLNKNTSSSKFVLDDEELSKYERTLTGNYDSYHVILAPKLPVSVSSSGVNTPTKKSALNTPTGSVSSKSSYRFETKVTDEMNSSIVSQKKIRVRRAIICEDLPMEKCEQIPKEEDSCRVVNSLKTSRDHLETKKQIENLRHQYGSEWLQSQAGDMLKNVIGFDPTEKEFESVQHYESKKSSRVLKSTPLKADQNKSQSYTNDQSLLTSTPVDRESSKLLEACGSPIKLQRGRNSDGIASEADFKSIIPDDDSNYQSISDMTIENTSNLLNLNDIYANVVREESESGEEENEKSYFVKLSGNAKELCLVVSEASIREKDGQKTKTRWGIKTLESCERPTSSSITLLFNTIKKDKKMRTYDLDEQSSQELEQFLRAILSKRPLSEMNQKLFDCVVCKARFSREVNFSSTIENLQCPECSNGFCVEITESPAKWISKDNKSSFGIQTEHTEAAKPYSDEPMPGPSGISDDLKQCDSKSSIGSTGSLNDSSSCSRISQPSSSCDSNRSVAGSTNSERDRDVDLLGNDSDIEVLSNPSQSSIEVLDRGFHPSRKHSEERKNLQLPDLEALNDESLKKISTTLTNPETSTHDLMAKVADTFNKIIQIENASSGEKETTLLQKPNLVTHRKSFLTAANLTESSSSGSVTDSICTAYESNQDSKKISTLDEPMESGKPKKELQMVETGINTSASKPENSVISSVLGGLLQSTNMLMSKAPKSSKSDSTTKLAFEPIKYSYTDYANVDHRLKLYLYQNLFEDANETLKWLVSCVIFDENELDKWPTGFDGLFIMSTTKFYVMRKTAAENDDPSTWMKKHLSGTIDRVGIAQVLPWKIGMKFVISAVGGIHIILQDILRTDCLILFFADNPLPEYCKIDYQPSELLTNKLSKASGDEMVKILMVINLCDVLSDDVLQTVQLCTLLLTDSHLYLTVDIKWLNENSKYQIEPKYTQLMTNLVELEDIHSLSCRLNFVDEQEDKYETWRMDFATVTAKDSAISTICNSWEKIFGVPLLNKTDQSNSNKVKLNANSITSHSSINTEP